MTGNGQERTSLGQGHIRFGSKADHIQNGRVDRLAPVSQLMSAPWLHVSLTGVA